MTGGRTGDEQESRCLDKVAGQALAEGRTRESGGGVMGSIIDHYAESKVGWGRG